MLQFYVIPGRWRVSEIIYDRISQIFFCLEKVYHIHVL